SDSTILDAIRSARKYGVELMADILSVENPVKRAKELEKMGIDYINVHIGIDQQMTGQDAVNLLKEVSNEVKVPIAVAGGLDANSAKLAVGLGANIVIVGGNIVRSSNVTESARKIRDSIDEASKIKLTELRHVKSKDEEIREIFLKVSTPNISDAMHRKGAMKNIKPLCNKVKLVGTAVTVQTFEGDWAKTVEAIDVADEGDVIVIYAGSAQVAVWGELATLSCLNKKISGVVIDGAVRDAREIMELQYPVFAKFITPKAGEPKGFGEINAEITCGGSTVKPGDYIIGDENGVIVVPKERSYEIARRALEVEKNERRLREEIKRGRTLSEIVELYKWEKK
ncbi:MAG: orotidine 5'-phosphate decarboxylase / HUMPS family protein, partial [Methanosarcinales archaeon]